MSCRRGVAVAPVCTVVLLALSALASRAADPGAPPPPEPLAVRDLGPLETDPAITGRDGLYSTRVGGVSVWVYGDTALATPGADGGTWRNNTMSWTHDLHAADGLTGFDDWDDAIGVPREFMPYTVEEEDYNARHRGDNCVEPPCNVKYGMWPAALIDDRARRRVLYAYAKMWLGQGAWNFSTVGRGIAVGPPLGPVTRPIVRPGATEPTLLFDADTPGFVNAAFTEPVDGVPHVYFFDCTGDGFLKPMRLARVPLADVLDRAAWRFWAGNGTWSADVADAAVVFDGADQLSVHWNAYVGRYLAIYVDPLSTRMVARAADRPEGPWSDEVLLFETLPPVTDGLVYCGMAHLELQRDGGRFETLAYVRDTGPFRSERRLVEVEFAKRVPADARDAVYDPQRGVALSDAVNRNQVCVGTDGQLWRQMALQFPLRVPQGATITGATVELISSGRNAGSFTTAIRGIAQDDVAPFVAGSQPAFTDGYPLTAAAVAWTPENRPAGTRVATPELRALFQEVVSRPGWLVGAHVGLVFPETRTGQNIRCFQDWSSGAANSAIARLGWYASGAAVCLDARAGEDALKVSREPAAGCPAGAPGPPREFVFGRLGALRTLGATVDLGPVRCASPGDAARSVVRAAPPDEPPGDASIFLVRAAGATNFGTGVLPDGSRPERRAATSACP